jgi:asparagine synthase (glutamine-hydrolysing)
MCGITGWVSFERDLRREGATLDAMTATMACRGPDASGTWLDGYAGLGHRRLAVIDPAGGAQPMSVSTPGGEVVLVYSGEAYNFTELRTELVAHGERFATASDTEVVLRGYLRWGEGLADRLNGMYAFAIWDGRERKLVLVRDRLGIKPLFMARTAAGVLFGSEAKAILANPHASRVVDTDGLRELFALINTPGLSVWSGIREVLPGTVVTADQRGVRQRTYWRLETRDHRDDLDTTIGRVRELLDDSVRRQLVADVPLCVLLSGGLDSSVLTALSAARLRADGRRVRSFAVDFVGHAENFTPDELRAAADTPFVRDVAEHVGSDHTDVVLGHTELADPDTRRAVVGAWDSPADLGNLDSSLYLLFRSIRRHSTVAISGESADEIFAGYRQFHEPRIQRLDAFPWIALLGQLFDTAGSALNPDLRAALDLNGYRQERYRDATAEVGRLDSEDEFTHRMRVMSYLHLTRFLQFMLDRTDRMSMATGLEVRVPFCDHRLVEYVYNTPWSMKTYDGREKSLLRGACAHLLPQSVVQRPKSPYPATQDPHYAGALQQQAKQLLADSDDTLFALIDYSWLESAVGRDPTTMPPVVRHGLERTLSVATWLDLYRPTVRF